MVILRYTLSILLCYVFIIDHNFFRSDAIHPVAVLSDQVDSQIVEENTMAVPVQWSLLLVVICYYFRKYCVLCLWLILTFLKLDAILLMTVLSNHVDSQIDEDNMAVPVQWSLLRVIICSSFRIYCVLCSWLILTFLNQMPFVLWQFCQIKWVV